jgi:hypothetical protein
VATLDHVTNGQQQDHRQVNEDHEDCHTDEDKADIGLDLNVVDKVGEDHQLDATIVDEVLVEVFEVVFDTFGEGTDVGDVHAAKEVEEHYALDLKNIVVYKVSIEHHG